MSSHSSPSRSLLITNALILLVTVHSDGLQHNINININHNNNNNNNNYCSKNVYMPWCLAAPYKKGSPLIPVSSLPNTTELLMGGVLVNFSNINKTLSSSYNHSIASYCSWNCSETFGGNCIHTQHLIKKEGDMEYVSNNNTVISGGKAGRFATSDLKKLPNVTRNNDTNPTKLITVNTNINNDDYNNISSYAPILLPVYNSNDYYINVIRSPIPNIASLLSNDSGVSSCPVLCQWLPALYMHKKYPNTSHNILAEGPSQDNADNNNNNNNIYRKEARESHKVFTSKEKCEACMTMSFCYYCITTEECIQGSMYCKGGRIVNDCKDLDPNSEPTSLFPGAAFLAKVAALSVMFVVLLLMSCALFLYRDRILGVFRDCVRAIRYRARGGDTHPPEAAVLLLGSDSTHLYLSPGEGAVSTAEVSEGTEGGVVPHVGQSDSTGVSLAVPATDTGDSSSSSAALAGSIHDSSHIRDNIMVRHNNNTSVRESEDCSNIYDDNNINSESVCMLCYDRPPSVTFIPCYHSYYCEKCCSKIRACSGEYVCPSCRCPVVAMVNFTSIQ